MALNYGHQFVTDLPEPAATFSVTSGPLPPGLTLTPGGILTGIPNQAGTFGPTTVCASNGVQASVCQTFTIVIEKRQTSMVATPSPGGPVGTAVHDTATLLGLFAPTGSVTFRLFSDAACTNEVFSSTTSSTPTASPPRASSSPPLRAPTTGPWSTAVTPTTCPSPSRATPATR